jgi:hypothetical protein
MSSIANCALAILSPRALVDSAGSSEGLIPEPAARSPRRDVCHDACKGARSESAFMHMHPGPQRTWPAKS